jgi:hypothetical protein
MFVSIDPTGTSILTVDPDIIKSVFAEPRVKVTPPVFTPLMLPFSSKMISVELDPSPMYRSPPPAPISIMLGEVKLMADPDIIKVSELSKEMLAFSTPVFLKDCDPLAGIITMSFAILFQSS